MVDNETYAPTLGARLAENMKRTEAAERERDLERQKQERIELEKPIRLELARIRDVIHTAIIKGEVPPPEEVRRVCWNTRLYTDKISEDLFITECVPTPDRDFTLDIRSQSNPFNHIWKEFVTDFLMDELMPSVFRATIVSHEDDDRDYDAWLIGVTPTFKK